MGSLIKTEQHGRVVLATLDNPPHALLTDPMVKELDALVRSTEQDDGVGVVILTGAHPDRFLAHYDVGELLRVAKKSPPISFSQAKTTASVTHRLATLPGARGLLNRTPVRGVLQLQDFHETLLRMGRSGVIFIAAINGQTAGGGLELSLACDLRYISDRGEVAQPEVLLGFPPGGGGTQRLARLIGRGRALELMLTGRGVSPREAMELGLVTGVLPHEQLVASVMALAEPLARRFKPAVAVIKQAVLEGGSLPLEDGLQLEQAAFLSMLGTPEAQRAMQAYVDATGQTGELPAVDPAARQRLQDGTFSDFTRR
jgi:enoyl-CoA hydratase/carnithine racemase